MGNLEKELFNLRPEERIREENVSLAAVNSFVKHTSGARSYMTTNHLAQTLTLNHGEEKIVQSGLENQLGTNTFNVRVDKDARVLGMVNRYSSYLPEFVSEKPIELLIFVCYLEDGEFDVLTIPSYFTLHQYFGFEYKVNTDVISQLRIDSIIPAGTILADSPAVGENDGYAFGLNANTALISLPEVSEDGIIISESFSKKLSYTIYETRVIDLPVGKHLLNLYGDLKTFKPFPNIGEQVREDGILLAIRSLDPTYYPGMSSLADMRTFDPYIDEILYLKYGSKDVEIIEDGVRKSVPSGIVTDIKIYQNLKPKNRANNIATNTEFLAEYAEQYRKYYKEIFNIYKSIKSQNSSVSGLNISPRLQSLLIDAQVLGAEANHQPTLTFKTVPIEQFRIEITVKHVVTATIGSKLTDLHGCKGVIVDIWEDERCPRDKFGNIADLISDPNATISRSNISRLYENYFNAVSRKVKKFVLNEPDPIYAFSVILDLLKIISQEQYKTYADTTREERMMIIEEIKQKEFFILFRLSTPRLTAEIVRDIENTIFKPDIDHIYINGDTNGELSKDKICIAPLYTILLNKVAVDMINASSSPKLNHYGFPITTSKKQKNSLPFKDNPTRILSETETRLFQASGGSKALIELKDRGSSIPTNIEIWKNILEADKPTNVKNLVDREKCPYGNDVALRLIKNILRVSGIDMEYRNDEISNLDIKHHTTNPRVGLTKKGKRNDVNK